MKIKTKQKPVGEQQTSSHREERLVRPLEAGCVVTTNGGQRHTIAEIGFGGSEGVAENCFYHWDKDWPYEIEHAAMNPDRDAIVSVSWSNADVDLPDTAAQDSASKSNNPAVSG